MATPQMEWHMIRDIRLHFNLHIKLYCKINNKFSAVLNVTVEINIKNKNDNGTVRCTYINVKLQLKSGVFFLVQRLFTNLRGFTQKFEFSVRK